MSFGLRRSLSSLSQISSSRRYIQKRKASSFLYSNWYLFAAVGLTRVKGSWVGELSLTLLSQYRLLRLVLCIVSSHLSIIGSTIFKMAASRRSSSVLLIRSSCNSQTLRFAMRSAGGAVLRGIAIKARRILSVSPFKHLFLASPYDLRPLFSER